MCIAEQGGLIFLFFFFLLLLYIKPVIQKIKTAFGRTFSDGGRDFACRDMAILHTAKAWTGVFIYPYRHLAASKSPPGEKGVVTSCPGGKKNPTKPKPSQKSAFSPQRRGGAARECAVLCCHLAAARQAAPRQSAPQRSCGRRPEPASEQLKHKNFKKKKKRGKKPHFKYLPAYRRRCRNLALFCGTDARAYGKKCSPLRGNVSLPPAST